MIERRFPVTARAYFLMALAVLLTAFTVCCACNNAKDEELISLQLIYQYPLTVLNDSAGKRIGYFKDTITIFYTHDLVLYRLSGTKDMETSTTIKGTEPFFLFKKGAKYGLLFSSAKDSSGGVKKDVDSFLIKNAMKSLHFEKPDSSMKLSATEKENGSDNIIEEYVSLPKREETRPDSIYYFFTRQLKDFDYSFSKEIDSIKQMKLYKLKLIYNEYRSPANEVIYPKREMYWEIRRTPSKETVMIKDFIKHFSKALTTMK